mmetsp:Transcript_9235/g.22866  ORF Transcript_9235/g.22866 Transcript_9235/m.22866 type:complete len:369 (+) Transcript_9235:356-1462(+)
MVTKLGVAYFLFASLVTYVFLAVKRWWEWTRDLESDRREEGKRTLANRGKPSTKRLSIIIPAYNEEKRLPAVLTETLRYLVRRRDREGASFTYEVIVVDDGSTDQTAVKAWLCAKELGAEDAVRVYQMSRNSGKGAAVRTGMLNAEGDLLLMMDADGATELSHGLEALEFSLCSRHIKKTKGGSGGGAVGGGNGGGGGGRVGRGGGVGGSKRKKDGQPPAGIIQQAGGYSHLSQQRLGAFGSRAHLEQEDIVTKRTKLRNFAMHGFHLLVFLVVGGSIRDTQCGFKLFTRAAAAELFRHQRLKRWCFDVEVIHIAQRLKVPIVEVQVKWEEKEGSKLKFLHVFHMTLELLTIFVCYNLRFWRVKALSD